MRWGPQLHAADSCSLGGQTGSVGRIQPSRAPSIMAPFSSFPYLQQYGWRRLSLSLSLGPVTSYPLRRRSFSMPLMTSEPRFAEL